MASFQPLDHSAFLPPTSTKLDTYGWHLFSSAKPTLVDTHGLAVTHVHCSSSTGICVASTGSQVQMYSFDNSKREDFTKTKIFTKLKGEAYSARLRQDGRLVCVGSHSGQVVVFDSGSRATMRTFAAHGGACRAVRWTLDGNRMISGSIDKTSKMFDLQSEQVVCTFKGHGDEVKAVTSMSSSGGDAVWATGSYDHTIRIWDARAGTSGQIINQCDHGAPVEDLTMLFSANSLVSVGGLHVRLWDSRAMRVPVHSQSHHAKTVTGVVFSAKEASLLTCSLDGTVRVMTQELDLIQTLKWKGQLLSVCISDDDWRIMVGSAQGEFVVRTRRGFPPTLPGDADVAPAVAVNDEEPPVAGTRKYFNRGGQNSSIPPDSDVLVVPQAKRARKLRPHDVLLKKFSYREALDVALETREPSTVAAVLEELSQRGADALDVALGGRDETELEPILAYLTRFVAHPRFSHLLIPVCERVFSMYEMGTSVVVDQSAGKLLTQVNQEVDVHKGLMEVLGGLELLR